MMATSEDRSENVVGGVIMLISKTSLFIGCKTAPTSTEVEITISTSRNDS